MRRFTNKISHLYNDLALEKMAGVVGDNGTHVTNSHENRTDYDAEGHREDWQEMEWAFHDVEEM